MVSNVKRCHFLKSRTKFAAYVKVKKKKNPHSTFNILKDDNVLSLLTNQEEFGGLSSATWFENVKFHGRKQCIKVFLIKISCGCMIMWFITLHLG